MGDFSFTNLFRGSSSSAGGGGASGAGIVHNPTGKVTAPQHANPTQQLTGSTPAPSPAPAPAPDPINSQLEDMAKVWQTPTTADGKPIAPQADPLYQPIFNFKPEDVRKSAETLDFTAGINPELAQKAIGGDADALIQLINGAARNAFAAGVTNSGKLINDGFQLNAKNLDQSLPKRLRNHEILQSTSENPVLQHAAVQPLLRAMKLTIAQNHPQLTPEEVQQAAEEYVTGVSGVLTASSEKVVAEKKQAAEPNWMKYAGLE